MRITGLKFWKRCHNFLQYPFKHVKFKKINEQFLVLNRIQFSRYNSHNLVGVQPTK